MRKTALYAALYALCLLAFPHAANAGEFKGYPCTQDCSGHKAGYEWAQKNNIIDPEDCRGKSKSFVEGCRIYVAEQQAKEHPKH